MEYSLNFPVNEVVRFAIVLFRVMGIMVFAPFFSSRSIPFQVRITASLAITWALMPAVRLTLPAGFGLVQVVAASAGEILFGLVLGLLAAFIFAGLQMAGQMIGLQLGFSMINVIDPQSEVETTVVEFLENYLGLMFFLLFNCHHWFLRAIGDSFNYLPLDGVHLSGSLVQEVVRLSSQVLVTGLQIAGPVIAVSVIADVVLGIIGRAAPQIHIMIVGMPLKTLIGMSFLGVSFYFLPQYLSNALLQLYRSINSLMPALGRG
jgi:flagellar biosynthetic protein FliR